MSYVVVRPSRLSCPVLSYPVLSWPASIFVFIRFAVMATTLDALRSTASALCPFQPLLSPPHLSALLPPLCNLSTCSIFYTFKSSVLWRFCSRFKKTTVYLGISFTGHAAYACCPFTCPHLPTRYLRSSFLFF